MAALRRKAQKLVVRERRNIRAVAAALIEHGRLTAAQIERIT